jgi:HD-like signal output (HDOD) protein
MERAREIVHRAHAINPSPSLLRIEAELRSGSTSARQLARLIDGSPALAARVLRMANSGFYAPQEPVVSLARAVAMLGDTVLRQLVLTSLIASRRAGSRSARQAFAIARLMADAVRAAVVSRELAQMARAHDADTAFAAGLLHDLGHVYLVDEVGEPYGQYLVSGAGADTALATEYELAGTTHQDVGAVFAYEWNLPDVVAHVLWDHHRSQPGTLSSAVHAADLIVRDLSHPTTTEPETAQAEVEAALSANGIDRAKWDARGEQVKAQIAELLTLFDTLS